MADFQRCELEIGLTGLKCIPYLKHTSAVSNSSLLDLTLIRCSIFDVKYIMINNSSSCNDSFLNSTNHLARFPYAGIFITVFFLLPMFIIKILILVAIIRAKTVPSTIILILGNIVASSELIDICTTCGSLTT